ETHTHAYRKALVIQLNLAKEWAKEHKEQEWNERLQKSLEQGSLYEGPTSVIPDKDFIQRHSRDNVVEDLVDSSYEYDARASYNLIKSDLEDSDIGGESKESDAIYNQIYSTVRKNLKD